MRTVGGFDCLHDRVRDALFSRLPVRLHRNTGITTRRARSREALYVVQLLAQQTNPHCILLQLLTARIRQVKIYSNDTVTVQSYIEYLTFNISKWQNVESMFFKLLMDTFKYDSP